jgi:hypothetical protein
MKIQRTLILACSLFAGFAAAGTASARECKTESVTAEGDVATLRDLGAYPNSLFAWRNAVKEKFGGEWNSWRYAEKATVDCKEITSGGKKGWKCTRNAIPCQDTLSTVVGAATAKKTCKAEALSATGSKKKTEKDAVEESKSAWRIDTKKKYGADWAKLDNASGADQDCRKVSSGFQCITVATPCKPD